MNIKELANEYITQDNCFTAHPIYVMVQEMVCIGVIDYDYDVICSYGDGKVEYETNDNGDEIKLGYIWHPVEFFLTIKGAEKYIRLNSYNHTGALRTYISRFSDKNSEMQNLINNIILK